MRYCFEMRNFTFTWLMVAGLCSSGQLRAEAIEDPELLGKWAYSFLIYADDVLTIPKPGVIQEHSVLGGKLFVDAEASYVIDMTTEPKRMIETVVRVNPDQVVQAKPGDQYYCIYQVVKKNVLELDCSDINVKVFPTEFNDAFAYGKVN
jgi:hypothetical protein